MQISQASTEVSGRKVIAILSAAAFMNLTDTSVINIAMPSIRQELVGSVIDAEWVVAGYILAVAIGLLPFGRLGDIIGHKRLFLTGVGCFLIASLLCAFSPSPHWLIVGRVTQGLSCSMMVPQAPALSRILFNGEARGRALAMLSFVGGIASMFGPLMGGYLIGLDLWGSGWRAIFLLNLPFGMAALWFGLRHLPSAKEQPKQGLDLAGICLLGGAMLATMVGLIEGRAQAWPLWTFGIALVAISLFLGFYVWTRQRARSALPQLIPLALLHSRGFMLSAAVLMLYFSTCTSLFIVIASVLQKGLGATPLESAAYTMAYPLALMLTTSRVTKLSSVGLHARVLIGTALSVVSMGGIAMIAYVAPTSIGLVSLALPLALAGAGLGFIVPSMMQIALSFSEQKDAGAAAGALHSFQQLAGAIGIPVASLVFYRAGFDSSDAQVRAMAYGEGLLSVSFLFFSIFIVMGAFAGTLAQLPKE